MKKLLLLALPAVLMLSACSGGKLYPMAAHVVELDRAEDLVTVETATGMLFQFYGCEDYQNGDLVSMIMDDNGTPNDVTDDMILDARYSG